MKVETFLDYNQILTIIFDISEAGVDYDFICSTEDEHLSQKIINNLKSISSIKETEDPDIYRLDINNTIFINIKKSTGEIESVNKLTAFETRVLAQSREKSVPFSREGVSDFKPKTDLHTHYAGAMTPEILVKVGKEKDISYPARLLTKIGVDITKYEIDQEGKIKLNSIDEEDIDLLKSKLMISPVTQETFNKMEEVYTFRILRKLPIK